MSRALRILMMAMLLIFAAGSAYAKKDPVLDQLIKDLANVKNNTDKVDLQIKIANRYLLIKSPKCDEYCKAAIKLADKNKLYNQKADALEIQAQYYFDTKKYSKAASSYLEEYNLRKKLKQNDNAVEAAYNLGLSYSKVNPPFGGYKKAKKYLDEALAYAQKKKDKDFENNVIHALYEAAYKSGKYKEAADYVQRNLKYENRLLQHDVRKLQDSIVVRDCTIVRQDSVIAEVKQQNEELDTLAHQQGRQIVELTKEQLFAQIESVQKSNDMLKQEKEQQKRMMILGFVILLGAILIIILFIRYREKNKMNKLLAERNKVIVDQNQQITTNLKIINEKNRDITDSLNYAGKIQKSLLKNFTNYSHLLSGYFIFYRPKDIVSGDFYWGHQIDNKFVFTVGDCTGHSVPGAFMSMLGISLLNQIVGQQHIIKASAILEQMRMSVKLNLGQSGDNDEEAKDGMDMALCVWDKTTNKINYSGAYNPLFIVRNGVLSVYNAEKCPVGIHTKELDFTDQYVDVQKGDRLFLFSDGYADQFGGPKFEKFKIARFKKLLTDTSGLPILRQYDKLEAAFDDWKQDMVQIDDVCVLGLEI